jgi:hypothetical protein
VSIKPLSRDEFAAALKKGQGRALQHIAHFGLGEYKELVLEACLHNQIYDTYDSRAPWLFSMFQNTLYYEEFRETIQNHLETSTPWDLIQLSDLLREMVEAGDNLARQRLKETVFNQAYKSSEDEDIIIDEWVDLQTTDEFIELARIFGNRLMENHEVHPFDGLIPEEKKQEFKEILHQYAQNDLSIRKYWEYLDEQGKLADTPPPSFNRDTYVSDSHDRIRKCYNLDQTLRDAQNKEGNHIRYITFGENATQEELDTIFASLMSEKDPEVQMRFLWVFRRAQLPALNDSLFQWANGSERGLRASAIAALAQLKEEKVHQLAKEKVKRAELLGPDHEVINLFQKNYDKSDARLITSALCSIEANEEDTHSIGYGLVKLAEIQGDPGLSGGLKWVYEYTRCMYCRYKALKQLKAFNEIDERISQELPFDADESIRELVGEC